MKRQNLYAVLTGIVLVFALAFAGCDMEVIINEAGGPVILKQPSNQKVVIPFGAEFAKPTLTVLAVSPDDGKLSYQWYPYVNRTEYLLQTGTGIPGATAASFIPELEMGIYEYYVIVTNTNNKAKVKSASLPSRVVTITVNEEGAAEIPEITEEPEAYQIIYRAANMVVSLSATAAEVSDGGTLTWQWYELENEDDKEGTPIPGADGRSELAECDISYTASIAAGTRYYYCVVFTNTNLEATGRTEATRRSETAVCEIASHPAAETPIISGQPQDRTYVKNTPAVALSVTASSPDGEPSYRWYSSTTSATAGFAEISGSAGEGDSYIPDVSSAGTWWYKVKVTNTNPYAAATTSVDSNTARITVLDQLAAAFAPVITAQPQSADYSINQTAQPLTVTVTSPEDGGTLSYRWYSSTTSATAGFAEISGSTGAAASYTPPITVGTPPVSAGTRWYYVTVTNTNTQATQQTTSVDSNVATIIVRAVDPTAQNTVTVSLTKRQYVRGFGGMDNPWNNVKGLTLAEYEKMYDPEQLGYNIMRIMVTAHSTDYNDTLTKLLAGTLVHSNEGYLNRPNQVEGVKIVNKYGGYVLASPWSPPAAWKTNNSWNGGGSLKTADYQNYADYLKSVGAVYANRGAPIYAVSIQNEPNFTATYEGCEWSDAQMSNFFAQVGHFTTGQAGWGGGAATPYVLTMNGESANTPTINNTALSNTTARAAIDLLGRHQYGNVTTTISNLYGKEMWMTEMNKNSGSASTYPNDSTWNYVWKFMNFVDVAIRINSENAYIWWTAKRFYSMIGDGDYGTSEGTILPRGYGLAHYAKFAKETGRVDVSTSGAATNVNGSTFAEDNTNVKISAFVTMNDDFYEAGVIDRNTRWSNLSLDVSKIKAISLVMFTPGGTSSTGGTNMQTVKIQLPSGFTIGSAEAIKSDSGVKLAAEPVTIGVNMDCAFVTLPARTILSVRLNKVE